MNPPFPIPKKLPPFPEGGFPCDGEDEADEPSAVVRSTPYYYRLELDGMVTEVGFKTHAELMAFIADQASRTRGP